MNKSQIHLLFWIILLGSCLCLPLAGAVPEIINHQGRVTVNGVNFDGMGDFKFALVDAAGTPTFWSHDGTSGGGGEPTGSISLTVDKGLYSVGLGNDDPPFFMDKIPASIFEENSEVFLRIWFREGANPFEQLSPDQQITSVGFAMVAQEVLDPGVTTVFVSPVEGGTEADNGDALRDALMSITGSGPSNPFLVKVEPGLYDLGSTSLTMKNSVDIEGSGKSITKLIFSLTNNSAIFAANDTELRSLTVDVSFPTGGGSGIRNIGGSASISDVDLEVSGDGVLVLTAVTNEGVGNLKIKDSAITMSSSATNSLTGIQQFSAGSSMIAERVSVDLSGGVANRAVDVEGGEALLRNVDLSTEVGDGIFTVLDVEVLVFNSRIDGPNAINVVHADSTVNAESSQIIGAITGAGTAKLANCVDGNFDPLVEFDSSFIADNAITNAKLDTDAVTSDKIDDGAVAVADLDTTDVDLRYVNQDGDTMAGSLDMGGNSITGVGPNVTATGPLTVSATGGSNDLSLDSDNNIEINALSGSINLNSSGSTINLNANSNVTGTLDVSGGNITGTLNGTADNADTLDGFDSSEFASAAANTVTVGPVGSDVDNGLALVNALAGITDNGPSNPYVLKVEPGNYELSDTLVMKNDVDIEGSGIGVTRIISFSNSGAALSTADSAELRALSLRADFSSATGGNTAIIHANGDVASIKGVSIFTIGNGLGILGGIVNFGGDLDVSNTIIGLDEPSQSITGIRHFGTDSETTISRVKVFLLNGAGNNRAIAAERDGMELNNVKVDADQGDGLYASGVLLKVFNTRINAPTAVNSTEGGDIRAESSQIVGTVSEAGGTTKFVNCFDGNFDPLGVISSHTHTTIFTESFVVEGPLSPGASYAGPGIQISNSPESQFMVCTAGGSITRLFVHADQIPGSSQLTIVVRVNGGDSALSALLPGTQNEINASDSVSVAEGDRISVSLDPSIFGFADLSVTLEFSFDSSTP